MYEEPLKRTHLYVIPALARIIIIFDTNQTPTNFVGARWALFENSQLIIGTVRRDHTLNP